MDSVNFIPYAPPPKPQPLIQIHLFHISRLITYITYCLSQQKKGDRKPSAWVRRQKTEAAWSCLWCTMSARRWGEKVPRQIPREWWRKVSAVLCLFKIRPGLRGKPATGWPWQPPLTSSESGTEDMTVVVPWLRKGMVSRCSPAPCWGKCPGSDSPAFFALSKITQPNPKSQTGALWYINSSLDLSSLDFTGTTLAIWEL